MHCWAGGFPDAKSFIDWPRKQTWAGLGPPIWRHGRLSSAVIIKPEGGVLTDESREHYFLIATNIIPESQFNHSNYQAQHLFLGGVGAESDQE